MSTTAARVHTDLDGSPMISLLEFAWVGNRRRPVSTAVGTPPPQLGDLPNDNSSSRTSRASAFVSSPAHATETEASVAVSLGATSPLGVGSSRKRTMWPRATESLEQQSRAPKALSGEQQSVVAALWPSVTACPADVSLNGENTYSSETSWTVGRRDSGRFSDAFSRLPPLDTTEELCDDAPEDAAAFVRACRLSFDRTRDSLLLRLSSGLGAHTRKSKGCQQPCDTVDADDSSAGQVLVSDAIGVPAPLQRKRARGSDSDAGSPDSALAALEAELQNAFVREQIAQRCRRMATNDRLPLKVLIQCVAAVLPSERPLPPAEMFELLLRVSLGWTPRARALSPGKTNEEPFPLVNDALKAAFPASPFLHVLREGEDTVPVFLRSGEYFAHRDTSCSVSSFLSLFDAVPAGAEVGMRRW